MKLKDFLKPYCSLLDVLFRIKDTNDKLEYNFKGDYLSYTKEAIWNEKILEFEMIDNRMLEGLVVTWSTYVTNQKVLITIYVRMVE